MLSEKAALTVVSSSEETCWDGDFDTHEDHHQTAVGAAVD